MRITEQLQHALTAGLRSGGLREIGPFVVLIDASTDNPFRNYAAPTSSRAPTIDEMRELVAHFGEHGRRPRLEFVEPAEPLTAALAAAGFEVVRRLPLLALGAAGVVGARAVPGVEVGIACADDLLGAAAVQAAAYADDEPVSALAERLRRVQAGGGNVAVARAAGRVVGAALHAAPAAGFAEIAAVAVAADWRRRGIGAAVSERIARAAVAAGVRPFLQAEGEPEARMYAPIGFERCGSFALAELSPAEQGDEDRPSVAPQETQQDTAYSE